MAKPIFALDIGTRSVVGIILTENQGIFHVADLLMIEHEERSMIDGQIHNIVSVATVITEIKKTLEAKHGPLKKVSVAAAGRALKTSEGAMEIEISNSELLAFDDIHRLELAAVQHAQHTLLSSDSINPQEDYYYCVGYSVLHYKLDGEKIGSLIDQTGRHASAEVIATFLPRVVVESLLAALHRAELEMEALTLEPIAAINVLIPPSMRRLNVALVDIGAGTSDIAITDQNTVVAYGMVPVAGDEITEQLSSHYLLDFPVAETVKRKIQLNEEVTLTDILGFEQHIAAEELTSVIEPAVERLAQAISTEMLRLNNGRAPQAVMVVGGGSLTPLLTEKLSSHLELPPNRVAIRGSDALSGVTIDADLAASPELVTPIGIAIAAKRAPIHYMSITVNNRSIRLFELKEMTVGDALLAANIRASQLYGMPGLGMSVDVNGKNIFIPGEHGTPSDILLNGESANIKDSISNGDQIEIKVGRNGCDAHAVVSDLLDELEPVHAVLNGAPLVIEPLILINGEKADSNTVLQDRDRIQFSFSRTLGNVLKKSGAEMAADQMFTLKINGQNILLKRKPPQFYVNGIEVQLSYTVQDGDIITFQAGALPTVQDVADETGRTLAATASVTFNGTIVKIEKPLFAIELNGVKALQSSIVHAGDSIVFHSLGDQTITFGDVFSFVEYELPKHPAKRYQLLRNGAPIGFNDTVFGGDTLELIFV